MPAPKTPVDLDSALFAELSNEEAVFIAESTAGAVLDPNILGAEVVPADAKPPFDANAEKPPEVGAPVAEVLASLDPNTEVGLPSTDCWPKAEVVAEAAEPHGEGRLRPGKPALPNAGLEVDPNAGAPNAGPVSDVTGFENAEFPKAGVGAEVVGFENPDDPKAGALLVTAAENAELPNVGAIVAGVEVELDVVPHGDVFCPSPDGAPKAPLAAPNAVAGRAPKAEVAVDGVPKVEVEGAPNAGASVCAGAGVACC